MTSKQSVGPATLEHFQAEAPRAAAGAWVGFDDVSDLPVTLAMEIGRCQITIRELLQLTAGSVIELDRGPADAFDVLVNGALLAHSEAVVVNDKCGVRLTDMISAAERILGRGA